ncbi:MAG TPA: PspC domain-containing protein [Acidimicrobiales bacterium]|nr:PspC domain-containing protein [Acidimicrobiales bacterium]
MTETASPSSPPTWTRRPPRPVDDRVVAGVAAAVGRWLGVDPTLVRVAFVVLAVAGGWGILLYLVGWAVLPEGRPDAAPAPPAAPGDPRRAVGLGLVVLGLLLLLRDIGAGFADAVVWPIALLGVGLAFTWRQTGHRPGGRLGGEGTDVARVVAGVVVASTGIGLLLAANLPARDVITGAVAAAVVVGGLLLVFGPWWWRLASDLAEERRARIRAAERAEVAAHLHDSVLQTLALIQRRADDDVEVARLARAQERELRAWLYGATDVATGGLRAAIEAAAAEVEDRFGARIEVVVVGDRPLDERRAALVAAAREAMVNAAKFAGTHQVSVFVEVADDRVEAFVRDRGAGFEPDSVAPDRRGIAESIQGRMARVGGRATVVSAPGDGAEVELVLPEGPA